jgi:hypothetical protein
MMKVVLALFLLCVGVWANDYAHFDSESQEGTIEAELIELPEAEEELQADAEEEEVEEEEQEEEQAEEEEEEEIAESFVEIGGQAMSEPDTLKLIFDEIKNLQNALSSAKTTYGIPKPVVAAPQPAKPAAPAAPLPLSPQEFKKAYSPVAGVVPEMDLQDAFKNFIASALPNTPASAAKAEEVTSFLRPKEQGSLGSLDRKIRKYESKIVNDQQNSRSRQLDELTSRLAKLANTVETLRRSSEEQAKLAEKLLAAAAVEAAKPAPKPVSVKTPPAPKAWPNGKPKKAKKVNAAAPKPKSKKNNKVKKNNQVKKTKKAVKAAAKQAKAEIKKQLKKIIKKQQQQQGANSYESLAKPNATPAPLKKATEAQLRAARAANKGDAPLPLQGTTVVPVDEASLKLPGSFEAKVKDILAIVRKEARKIYKSRGCSIKKRNPNARPKKYPIVKTAAPATANAVAARTDASPRGPTPKAAPMPVDPAAKKKTDSLVAQSQAIKAKAVEHSKSKPIKFRPLIRGKEPVPRSEKKKVDLSNVLNALPVKPAYLQNGPDMVQDVYNQVKNLPTFD